MDQLYTTSQVSNITENGPIIHDVTSVKYNSEMDQLYTTSQVSNLTVKWTNYTRRHKCQI